MKQNVKLTYLADTPALVPLCAQWAFDTWGKYNSAYTLEKRIESFKQHCNKDQIPITFLAWADEQVVGMASLRVTDGIRQDLSPWLGSLYVDDTFRGQGIGEQLIAAVKHKALMLGEQQIFLLTYEKSLPAWYASLGWQMVGDDTLFGNPITIMSSALVP